MKANILTAKFVDWLINKHNNEIKLIGLEVRFSCNDRKADVMCLKGGVIGYEIKGDLDNLTKLENQISDYNKCFNKVYVVTVPKHLESVRKKISKNIGIILYDNETFTCIRQARNRIYLSKHDVLCSINIDFLRKNKNINYRNDCAISFREYMSKVISNINLLKIWKEWLKHSYENNYLYFRTSEKGIKIHSEDISILSTKSQKIKPL